MNILDYLGTEFASFEEKPFNPVDSAALSQFCMVRAEGIVPPLRERSSFLDLGTIVENLLSPARSAVRFADALRAEGYTIASHSYGHLTYGDISPERLASDAQKWNDQIAAVIGETDVLLYPFGSDIAGVEAYKGAKFDTLYGLGFRYFCNVDSAEHWVQIHDGYVRQGRRNIDGYRMYYQSNLLDDLLDTKTVWDDARPTPVPKI